MPRIRSAPLAALLFIATLCASCGAPATGDAGASGASGPNSMTEANGWSQLDFQANFAKTVVDSFGHFNTSRNGCGQSASGAMALATWNRLASAVNRTAVELSRTGASRESRCVPVENPGKMDGTASVYLTGGKRMLLEMRGYDACAALSDPALTRELYEALNAFVIAADKEDCPNGWGG